MRHRTNAVMRSALRQHNAATMHFGKTGQEKILATLHTVMEKAHALEKKSGLGRGALTATLSEHLYDAWGVTARGGALSLANPSVFPSTIGALSDRIEETCETLDTHSATLMKSAPLETVEEIMNFASAASRLLHALPGKIIPPDRPAGRGR